ncbi:MAG: monovalent cation/H+ antiporter subunit A [Betaproteobacteria bacterium]
MTSAGPWLAALVAAPFAGALLPALLHRRPRAVIAWVTAAVPLAALALLLAFAPAVLRGETPAVAWPWIEAAGLEVALRLDGLSLLFSGLILAIGALIVLYGAYYLSPQDPFGRFFSMLLAFMGAMLGIFLSDNLLLTVVFWELTSLSSFLLIGYWSHRADARVGARMALAVTGLGGLALLGGALLLGSAAGTYRISELNLAGDALRAHPDYAVALVLVLLGAFTKSAQFPFHFWLPNAMAAPTPVSAYLHSATMVKAGIFLLARLWPALSGTELWFWLVGGTGLATLAIGAWAALFRHDLKGLLAYSTISHLGLIVLLLGLDSPMAAVAGVFHVINHDTFKDSLFKAAVIVDHETGTRDMRSLVGLFLAMPYTGTLAIVASAAMAGVPLLNGFLSKEMLFAETLRLKSLGILGWLFPVVALGAAVLSVAYSTRFVHDVFFGAPARDLPRTPHEPPRWMRIPEEVLAGLCLLVGMLPGATVGGLLAAASGAVVGAALPSYSLAVWHGLNGPLAMSALALVAGAILYFTLLHRFDLHGRDPSHGRWTAQRLFLDGLAALTRGAQRFTRLSADGTLHRQVALVLLVALALGAAPFVTTLPAHTFDVHTPFGPAAAAVWLVLAISTAAVVALHRQRLTAVILMGAVGLTVSLAFLGLSAPDLALTQLSVEVATVLLLLLALPFLPAATPVESTAARRWRDAALALACGLAMAAAAWWMTTTTGPTVSAEHIARSVAEGGGSNVVNVILVDFRGFDTYGEITVLAIAALGIVALLGGAPAPRPRVAGDEPAPAVFRPVMLSLLARVVLALALLLAVHIFLRGHNLPGGGFVAGLVTGVAVAMLYVANGGAWSAARLGLDFTRTLAAGLAVAGATGLAAWAWSKPFLTSAHGHLHLPVAGDIHWASAALFDLGVYLTVLGVVMLILEQLGWLRPARA